MGKKKAKRGPYTFEIELTMIPTTDTMTSDDALMWLWDDAAEYVSLVKEVLHCESSRSDDETANAFAMLGSEVASLIRACAQVAHGDGVGIRVSRPAPGSTDFLSALRNVAEVAAFRRENGDGWGDIARDELAGHLLKMIGEIQTETAKAREAA